MPGLYTSIIAPSKLTLGALERRGLPLDVQMRDELREEASGVLEAATQELSVAVSEFHTARTTRLSEYLDGARAEKELLKTREGLGGLSEGEHLPSCSKHPEYSGLTKRTKCTGCLTVWECADWVRTRAKSIQLRITRAGALLRQIGDEFSPTSDDHWRALLFDKAIGCGLTPMGRTGKRRLPSVRDEVIGKLQKKYQDNQYLRLRVAIQSVKTRLSTRLAVEPSADGCVHFEYHLHRSGPGRITSGKDDQDETKFSRTTGNAQNIKNRDRAIYRAETGCVFVASDWSQIEARVMATLAHEKRMLQAWREGLDIHALNGAAFAHALGVKCTAVGANTTYLRFAGETRSYRYAAKRMTHGWNYGMGAKHTAELFGLDVKVAQRLIDAYFDQWPGLRDYQTTLVDRAARDGFLINCFGRKFRFWGRRKHEQGGWTLSDPNEAISFPAQSAVSDMCKVLLPTMDRIAGSLRGSLRTTTHDSFLAMLPRGDAVEKYITAAREAMEREWPQLPVVEGFGTFKCPADFSTGYNWADYHVHDEGCPSPCSRFQNERGLRSYP